MTTATTGAGTTSYTYATDGLRTSKTVAATTTDFAWDDTTGVPQLIQDGNNYYLYGPDGLAFQRLGADPTRWLFTDATNSIIATTDTTGTITSNRVYNPWGNTTSHTGNPVSLGWQSQYQDPETNLYYLRHRYYDPSTAQFTTGDPLYPITQERYSYAGNDPVNGTDPLGLAPWDDWCINNPFGDDNCNSIAEQHPEVAQGIVDIASGALDINPITAATNSLGVTDTSRYANESSGWYHAGQAAMLIPDLALAGGALRGSKAAGDWAFTNRFLGADSRLFGNSSLGSVVGGCGGVLNSSGRGAWRIGWSVNGKIGAPTFRAKIAGRYIDILRASPFIQ